MSKTEKAKVYFTDFHTIAFGDGLPTKLKKLIRKAGIGSIDMDGKFVAIKMHFGELGNISYLRPNYAKAVVDVIKELGRQTIFNRLQYDVSRQPQECARAPGMRLGKRIYPVDCWMSNHHR